MTMKLSKSVGLLLFLLAGEGVARASEFGPIQLLCDERARCLSKITRDGDEGERLRKSLWASEGGDGTLMIQVEHLTDQGGLRVESYCARSFLVSLPIAEKDKLESWSGKRRLLSQRDDRMVFLFEVLKVTGLDQISRLCTHWQEHLGDSAKVTLNPMIFGYEDSWPNDPDLDLQWALNNTGTWPTVFGADLALENVWKFPVQRSGVTVAILDSGLEMEHPEIEGKVWVNRGEIEGNGIDDDENGFIDDVHGWNFLEDDASPVDDHGHGTHIAGIIAAKRNNGDGMVGVTDEVSVMPLRVVGGPSLGGRTSDAIAALNYCMENGVDVINLSWGTTQVNSLFRDALRQATGQGILVFAAAGNHGRDLERFPVYPAAFQISGLTTVTSHDARAQRDPRANWNAQLVPLAAPGRSIWSLDLAGGYRYRTGTSMAAPYVAGAAALLLSKTGRSGFEILDALKQSAKPLRGEFGIGLGRVDVQAALARLLPDEPWLHLPGRLQLLRGERLSFTLSDQFDFENPLAGLPDGVTFENGGFSGAPEIVGEWLPVLARSDGSLHEFHWRVRDDPLDWFTARTGRRPTDDGAWRMQDDDGDGRSNLLEYLADTDPEGWDQTVPQILSIGPGPKLCVSLPSRPGLTYHGSLGSGLWANGVSIHLRTLTDRVWERLITNEIQRTGNHSFQFEARWPGGRDRAIFLLSVE